MLLILLLLLLLLVAFAAAAAAAAAFVAAAAAAIAGNFGQNKVYQQQSQIAISLCVTTLHMLRYWALDTLHA